MSSPQSNEPRTAAVFGATGGIGRALCRELIGRGYGRVFAGSRAGQGPEIDNDPAQVIAPFAFDLEDENTIAAAVQIMRQTPPQLVIIATGALTLPDGSGPERSYKRIEPTHMTRLLALNTIGPALIAKHILPLFSRDTHNVFAALSARVGSISDNGLGGWHSYRASKAALNMLLRNFALEHGRTHKNDLVVGLHPGTVDTGLSEPFQANVPDGKLFTPAFSAKSMLNVLDRLTPEDSGAVFDWKGDRIPE
jgi:NAD(P)-dependent dehydrogenase (short-subunit alcohol dehydrogenase family)